MTLAVLAAGTAAAKESPAEKQAVALYNESTRAIAHARGCQQRPRPPTFTHAAPSQALLSTLSIMRRPATQEESTLATSRGFVFPFTKGIYADYIRIAHAADGHSYEIVAAQDALAFPPMKRACLHAIHVRLLQLLKGKPAGVRRRALHLFGTTVRVNRRLAHRPPREGVFMFDYRPNGLPGGGGGGATAAEIQARGMFSSNGVRGSARMSGLLPDGVATVTSFFSRRGFRKIYPKAIERTDPVQDNVVSFRVARRAEDAFPSKMIWRAAEGSIVKVVRQPG